MSSLGFRLPVDQASSPPLASLAPTTSLASPASSASPFAPPFSEVGPLYNNAAAFRFRKRRPTNLSLDLSSNHSHARTGSGSSTRSKRSLSKVPTLRGTGAPPFIPSRRSSTTVLQQDSSLSTLPSAAAVAALSRPQPSASAAIAPHLSPYTFPASPVNWAPPSPVPPSPLSPGVMSSFPAPPSGLRRATAYTVASVESIDSWAGPTASDAASCYPRSEEDEPKSSSLHRPRRAAGKRTSLTKQEREERVKQLKSEHKRQKRDRAHRTIDADAAAAAAADRSFIRKERLLGLPSFSNPGPQRLGPKAPDSPTHAKKRSGPTDAEMASWKQPRAARPSTAESLRISLPAAQRTSDLVSVDELGSPPLPTLLATHPYANLKIGIAEEEPLLDPAAAPPQGKTSMDSLSRADHWTKKALAQSGSEGDGMATPMLPSTPLALSFIPDDGSSSDGSDEWEDALGDQMGHGAEEPPAKPKSRREAARPSSGGAPGAPRSRPQSASTVASSRRDSIASNFTFATAYDVAPPSSMLSSGCVPPLPSLADAPYLRDFMRHRRGGSNGKPISKGPSGAKSRASSKDRSRNEVKRTGSRGGKRSRPVSSGAGCGIGMGESIKSKSSNVSLATTGDGFVDAEEQAEWMEVDGGGAYDDLDRAEEIVKAARKSSALDTKNALLSAAESRRRYSHLSSAQRLSEISTNSAGFPGGHRRPSAAMVRDALANRRYHAGLSHGKPSVDETRSWIDVEEHRSEALEALEAGPAGARAGRHDLPGSVPLFTRRSMTPQKASPVVKPPQDDQRPADDGVLMGSCSPRAAAVARRMRPLLLRPSPNSKNNARSSSPHSGASSCEEGALFRERRTGDGAAEAMTPSASEYSMASTAPTSGRPSPVISKGGMGGREEGLESLASPGGGLSSRETSTGSAEALLQLRPSSSSSTESAAHARALSAEKVRLSVVDEQAEISYAALAPSPTMQTFAVGQAKTSLSPSSLPAPLPSPTGSTKGYHLPTSLALSRPLSCEGHEPWSPSESGAPRSPTSSTTMAGVASDLAARLPTKPGHARTRSGSGSDLDSHEPCNWVVRGQGLEHLPARPLASRSSRSFADSLLGRRKNASPGDDPKTSGERSSRPTSRTSRYSGPRSSGEDGKTRTTISKSIGRMFGRRKGGRSFDSTRSQSSGSGQTVSSLPSARGQDQLHVPSSRSIRHSHASTELSISSHGHDSSQSAVVEPPTPKYVHRTRAGSVSSLPPNMAPATEPRKHAAAASRARSAIAIGGFDRSLREALASSPGDEDDDGNHDPRPVGHRELRGLTGTEALIATGNRGRPASRLIDVVREADAKMPTQPRMIKGRSCVIGDPKRIDHPMAEELLWRMISVPKGSRRASGGVRTSRR